MKYLLFAKVLMIWCLVWLGDSSSRQAHALGNNGLVMNSLDVVSGVRMRFGTTRVRSQITNLAPVPQQYHFVSYLPENAFITNFTMEVDNYQSIAILKERQTAEDLFDVAVKAGATAATTTADANVFTTKVNIGAGKTISFDLTYEEVLERKHGVYKHVINVQPNLEVDEMSVRIRIVERGRIDRNSLRVPQYGYSLSSKTNAELLLELQEPDVLVKTSINDRVSVVDVTYYPTESGQLLVLYDVERNFRDAGYLEVVDGYFVHFFAPKKNQDMEEGDKNIMFVLDSSYSMCGQRWDNLKKALKQTMEELREVDHFNLLTFNSEVYMWQLQSQPATKVNIADATKFLDSVNHNGGSNMHDALRVGLDMLRMDPRKSMISMLVLITDGHPSQGVLNPDTIVRSVTKLNTDRQYAVHTLALGRDVDYGLLSKLSSHNRGISRRIYEEDSQDSAEQIIGFFREVSSPLLRNVKIKYLDTEVDVKSLVAQHGPASRTYWDGGEIIVSGRLKKRNRSTMGVEVSGVNVGGKVVKLKSGGHVRRVNRRKATGFMERMWALLLIKDLLKSASGSVSPRKRRTQREKALKLAKRYNYVTELTSLLVIPLEVSDSFSVNPGRPLPHFAPEGSTGPEERSPVVKLIEEDATGGIININGGPSSSSAPEDIMVAGKPLEESVVSVDDIRSDNAINGQNGPSTQIGVLEENSIATNPLYNVDLETLIEIANPRAPGGDVGGLWRNNYVGPVTQSVQGYARLLSSVDPATRHSAFKIKKRARCGRGEKLDIVLALDVSEIEKPGQENLSGPGIRYVLKSIAQRLIGSFTFNRQSTRVGIIAFAPTADRSVVVYRFNQNQNPNTLLNVIGKTSQESISTSKYRNAFNLAYEMLQQEGRADAKRVIVLLSSTDSYGRHRSIADSIKERGISIMAVAPHQNVQSKITQLNFVAGGAHNVFLKPDISQMYSKFCSAYIHPLAALRLTRRR